MRTTQKNSPATTGSKTILEFTLKNGNTVKINNACLQAFVDDWPEDFLANGETSIDNIKNYFFDSFPDDGSVTFLKRSIKVLELLSAFMYDINATQDED
jgi:hypothetical protein